MATLGCPLRVMAVALDVDGIWQTNVNPVDDVENGHQIVSCTEWLLYKRPI